MGIKHWACGFHVILKDVCGSAGTWCQALDNPLTTFSSQYYWLVRLRTSSYSFLGRLRHILKWRSNYYFLMKRWLFLVYLAEKNIAPHNRWRPSCPAVPLWVPVPQMNKTQRQIYSWPLLRTLSYLFREAERMQVIHFSMSLSSILSQTGVLASSKNSLSCQRVSQHRNGQWGCVTVVAGGRNIYRLLTLGAPLCNSFFKKLLKIAFIFHHWIWFFSLYFFAIQRKSEVCEAKEVLCLTKYC